MVHKQTGDLLDTDREVHDSKWIFVMSTSKKLYAGEVRINLTSEIILLKSLLFSTLLFCFFAFQKKKGLFHHSSFLAGGATLAAGRLMAERGKLKV